MNKVINTIVMLMIFNFALSQEVYLNIGSNFTNYDYTNSKGEKNPKVISSNGAAFEIGYLFSLNDNIRLSTGITLDEFNALGGDFVNRYSWQTSYLGFQSTIKYNVLDVFKTFKGSHLDNQLFRIHLNLGLNFNHIVSGKQQINGQTFNLTTEKEFKGIFIKPLIGFDVQYFLLDNIALGIGYNVSKNFGVSNSTNQSLNFTNYQLQFNIVMKIK